MAPKAAKAKAAKPAVFVSQGLTALGRAKTYKRRGLAFIKKKNGGKFPTHPKKQTEEAPATTPKFYPPEDAPKPIFKKVNKKPTKLRSTITPGTVLILLAGRFKGKRVVFLKQLDSGLLLVTGPFKVNGVPLRRVNQAYVIATSTKLDVSAVDLSGITDKDFKAEKKMKKTGDKSDSDFFEQAATKKALSDELISRQKKVDTAILGKLDATMKGYLGARFSLKDGDRPHLMKF